MNINFGMNKITSAGFNYFLKKINKLTDDYLIQKVYFSKFF